MNNNLLKPDSTKSNFIFQFLYQTVILVLPLIVSPYLTRTLGSGSLGVYTYTNTIAYYFVVFAMLGINRYGQRIIAQKRNDTIQLRRTFWSLYCTHLIVSIIALVAYFAYVVFICTDDVIVAYAQSIYVFSALLDITWLFYGLEKFKIISIRNAIVKIAESVCIFLFVKEPSDVIVYTLIMSISGCLGNVVMMPQVLKNIPPIHFSKSDVCEHLKPLIILFAAVIAVTLYTVFDKTLLGILASKDDVAFYEYSDKIIKIPRTFNGIICTVLYPRACRYASERNYNALRNNANTCLTVTSIIGFSSAFGLAAVAENFVILYYGESFSICGQIIVYMCPIIVITGLGEAIRQGFVYPLGKDSSMVKILTANAVVNILLSAIMIPLFGVFGAVAGTIAAESVGLVLVCWISRDSIKFIESLKNIIPYAIIGAVMYIVVRLVGFCFNECQLIVEMIIQILTGTVTYVVLVLIYGYFYNRTLLDMIFSLWRSVIRRIKR